MRFLVDESSGVAIARYLENEGHDVIYVGETFPQVGDIDVLEMAVSQNRVLITNDKDFGELIYRSGRPHSGVLLLRLGDESVTNRVRVVKMVVDVHAMRLPGNFAVATEKGVRIRSTHP